MKKYQFIDLLADVKASIVSFISILMFVALGVGIFAGISWTSPALFAALEQVFDEGRMHDAVVQFPYGVTDDDVARLRALDGVSEVETAWSDQRKLSLDGADFTVNVLSRTERIDTAVQVEGELPAARGQIAVERHWADKHDVRIGSTVSLAGGVDSPTGAARMADDAFTVTALVEFAQYAALNSATYGFTSDGSGGVDCIMLAAPEAFDAKAFDGSWTDVYVRGDGLRGAATSSEAYRQLDDELLQSIKDLGATLGSQRYASLHEEAQEKVETGRKKLAEGEEKLEEGKKKVDAGAKKLAAAKKKLKAEKKKGEKELAAAKEKLDAGEEQYAAALKKLDAGEEKLGKAETVLAEVDFALGNAKNAVNDAISTKNALDDKLERGAITESEYEDQVEQLCTYVNQALEDAGGELGYDTGAEVTPDTFDSSLEAARMALAAADDMEFDYDGKTMTLAQAREEAASAREKIDSGRATLEEKRGELDDGWTRYEAGERELQERVAQAERDIAQGEKKVEKGEKRVEKGEKELSEKREELAAGEEKLAAMTEIGWVVTSRTDNGGIREAKSFTDITSHLRYSMAALFLVVGLLVCYSAVSRIVNEQVVQIGTKKALGLRRGEIYAHYLLYAGLAVLAGAVVGLAVGTTVVEGILSHALGKHFVTGAYPPYFSVVDALVITGSELVLIELATWLACRSMLKRHAVDLLRGAGQVEAKERFYEKWAFWGKLPLYTQTIVTNCLNEKRRVFSTIVGVAGCTALIVTAMTLNDNVLASYDAQYRDVYHYNAVVNFAGDDANASLEQAAAELEGRGVPVAEVLRETYLYDLEDGSLGTITMTVPADDDAFTRLVALSSTDGGAVDLGADGVWVSNAYAEHNHKGAGDEISVTSTGGQTFHVPIAGFFRYYLTTSQMVVSAQAYRELFGQEPQYRTLLADTESAGMTQGKLKKVLASAGGHSSIKNEKKREKGSFDDFSSISTAVVGIYLALSVLMAIVVLLNLNVMCIEEKKRELIVLMINGFSTRDAKRYIYRDTIVLTMLGILAGLVLGCAMGSVTVMSVEPESASFLKGVDWLAVACGAAGSAVLAAVMCAVSLRAIPRLNLTDINKV